MPLFDWIDALATLEIQVGPFSILRNEMERWERELPRLLALRDERSEAEEAKLARSRWLEANRAERSFVCGFVPRPHELETGARPLNVMPEQLRIMQVIAAVLPTDLVFIRESEEDVEEVGRIPRNSIVGIEVMDRKGVHVPEPIHETIEPPQLALLVLTWTNEGAEDKDRFAFRSPWMAWQAGRRLMEARRR